eukprot:2340237-Prorocentrum_lima.AAC.1
MTSSLVGSEMCIRDRLSESIGPKLPRRSRSVCWGSLGCPTSACPSGGLPVSYTHLTLPTICSV